METCGVITDGVGEFGMEQMKGEGEGGGGSGKAYRWYSCMWPIEIQKTHRSGGEDIQGQYRLLSRQ